MDISMLKIGMILVCKYRGSVMVCAINENGFDVAWNSNRYSQSASDLGTILTLPAGVDSSSVGTNETDAKVNLTCLDCQKIRGEQCNGNSRICSLFEQVLELGDEMKLWPKNMDLSKYKSNTAQMV